MAQASVGQVRDDAEASPLVSISLHVVQEADLASALHPCWATIGQQPGDLVPGGPGSTELLFLCNVLLMEALLQKELEQIDARAGLGMGVDGTERATA